MNMNSVMRAVTILSLLAAIVLSVVSHQKMKDMSWTADDTLASERWVEAGVSFESGLDALQGTYTFNGVRFSDPAGPYIMTGHRNTHIAMKHGMTDLTADLTLNGVDVARVFLGWHIVYETFDPKDTSWIPLHSSDFMSALSALPQGKFYLAEDIDLSSMREQIETFSGVITNPFGYVIRGVRTVSGSTEQGIFNTLQGAQIDGLTIEDAAIDVEGDTGTSYVVGTLASTAFSSVITNTHVQGDIRTDYAIAGGLVGASYGSVYRAVSFSGTLYGRNAIGGLLGFHQGFEDKRIQNPGDIWTSVVVQRPVDVIRYAFVDADLLGGSYANVGAMIGVFNGRADLSYGYITGMMDRGETLNGVSYVTRNQWRTSENSVYDNIFLDASLRVSDVTGTDGDRVTFVDPGIILGADIPEGLSFLETNSAGALDIPYWRPET